MAMRNGAEWIRMMQWFLKGRAVLKGSKAATKVAAMLEPLTKSGRAT
jgi:hypothetical protein